MVRSILQHKPCDFYFQPPQIVKIDIVVVDFLKKVFSYSMIYV